MPGSYDFIDINGNPIEEKLQCTPNSAGLMCADEKTKLAGIAENANNYVHPANHPATMITEDTTHKFVTDAEKATWNAKASTSVATAVSDGLMASTDKSKLDGIADNANNYTHPANHAATMITEDSTHRFVTDAEKNKWNTKAESGDLSSHTGNKNNPHGVTKAQVGLGNVTNDVQVKRSEMGVASGVATLDTAGKVPASQLPSYVDDVIEGYLSAGKFYKEAAHTTQITGESGKIYIDLSTNKTYRWSGSAFAVISETLALGTTATTAYYGDKGKIAYDHSQTAHAPSNANYYEHPANHPATMITQDTTHRFMTDTERTKLTGIADGANKYTHPATHPATMITEDTTHKFVTDAEKATWNGKTTMSEVEAKGYQTAAQVKAIKVNNAGNADTVGGHTVAVNVPAGAKFTDTVYTHPTNHEATMITQDTTHRFVTDTEKATWNGKVDKTYVDNLMKVDLTLEV